MPRERCVGWVAFYEGQADSAYHDVLLPRVMEEITAAEAVRAVVGRQKSRRDGATLFARVAQSQRIDALRGSRSFRAFEADLRADLADLGCLARGRSGVTRKPHVDGIFTPDPGTFPGRSPRVAVTAA